MYLFLNVKYVSSWKKEKRYLGHWMKRKTRKMK